MAVVNRKIINFGFFMIIFQREYRNKIEVALIEPPPSGLPQMPFFSPVYAIPKKG
jgi:hypothetical protein